MRCFCDFRFCFLYGIVTTYFNPFRKIGLNRTTKLAFILKCHHFNDLRISKLRIFLVIVRLFQRGWQKRAKKSRLTTVVRRGLKAITSVVF